jgi:anti-anti-sigma regulatory factor
MRIETTYQRRIGLAIIGVLAVGIFLVLLSQLFILRPPVSQIASAAVGLAVAILLFAAYWRGWRYAPHATVVFFTLLAAAALPEPFVSAQVSFAVLIPPVLALILLSPAWVIGSAVIVIAGILIRAGFGGVYADPIMLTLYGMAIGGIILARLVTDIAHRRAEENAQRAEAERLRAEAQARELAEANELMNTQLDQQQELLDLVATLETPAVQLADGVLFAPLVGHVDSRRAQTLTSRLLQAANEQHARLIILDVAGVSVIDTSVAKALINTAHSLRLLGCQVAISGITANVAMTLINLGISLDGITTARSPQEALAHYTAASTRENHTN